MISDERLEMIAKYDTFVSLGETEAMAKELQAYRKAFSEPALWANKTDVESVSDHILARRNQSLACTLPLYRKPAIPE